MQTQLQTSIVQLLNDISRDSVVSRIKKYLDDTETKYQLSDPEFGARLALANGLKAYASGNLGLGAVLFVTDHSKIHVFNGQNKTNSGKYSERFNVHAETDCINKWANYLDRAGRPDHTFSINEDKKGILQGKKFVLFGTVEPCMKCHVELIHASSIARETLGYDTIVHSCSTVKDGELMSYEGVLTTNGAAIALDDKQKLIPMQWRNIHISRYADIPAVKFDRLETMDGELMELSAELYFKSRKKIDGYKDGCE